MKTLIILITFLLSVHAQDVGASIYDNIIRKDIKQAKQNLKQLKMNLSENRSEKELKNSFLSLMVSWKKVETLYLAGELNEDYIDIPRYIDIFHNTNEDIYKQLNRIVLSSDALEIALFKNSTKSINALEYLIFTPIDKIERKKEMMKYIVKHIEKYLQEIESFYHDNRKLFIKNEKSINAAVMNALIESSYKLKEWRIGDAAGLSRKYKNNPNNARSEYPISKLSYNAIEAILSVHQALITEQEFVNFSAVIHNAGADKELKKVRTHLKNALHYLHKAPAYDFNSTAIKSLYKELTALHNAYFISLIGVLKVTSKIIDSDGD